ncbi:hypothetical protein AXX17_ATUG04560 [Arabidopsis thaliana]|uniref:NAD(P)H dehydrogenase (quinone) n=1 Tax=Arabidopsis thaliana TaxID=3702 RepID=A0A178U653_ARATH|nr:hypothetical protein AXX17_ATUG04560 [Arabidopsis thaliana]
MSIVVLYGGSRTGGNTELLTERALQGLTAERLHLRDYAVQPIHDLRHAPGGFQPVEDAYDALIDRVLRHDVLLFATPIYWYGMSGHLKNFIDRWSQTLRDAQRPAFKETMAAKTAYVVMVGGDHPRIKGLPLVQQFQYIFDFMGIEYGGYLIGKGSKPGDIERDAEALQQAELWRQNWQAEHGELVFVHLEITPRNAEWKMDINEMKLPESLHALLALADAVMVTDSGHRIVAVNASYEQVTGFASAEVLGCKAGVLRTPYTPVATYAGMRDALGAGLPWSGVFTNYKKNRDLWHSSITITPYVAGGDAYFVGIFRELEGLESGTYLDEARALRVQRSLLQVLAISCEIRDPGIEAHLSGVQTLTEQLAKRHNERMKLGLSLEKLSHLANSSILHDIGKSGIPEGILYKPGPLAEYERRIVEMHPAIGVDIVEKIFRELDDELFEQELSTARNIIRYHHERWDGTGYPDKLRGEAIPLEARLVSVVDVYDALTSKRPYKEKWSKADALRYVTEQKGRQFDPDVVDSFLLLISEETA